MSEYQWYEFVALDRPLTEKQMTALRAISTRAEISLTRFWNEYEWGDLKADPMELVARYFDAHLYFANWGTHRLVLRIPRAHVELKALKSYFIGERAARIKAVGEYVLLDLGSESEESEGDEDQRGVLAALTPLRIELMRGDMRSAYLAWLLAVASDDLEEEAEEPPVPAGLAELTAAQQAMVDFLRIDGDLVAAAALGSDVQKADSAGFRRWVAALSAKDKDAWLRRAAEDPELPLGGELLRAFQATKRAVPRGARRTVRELRELAEEARLTREAAVAAKAAKAGAAKAASRQRQLTKLAGDVEGAWATLEALVQQRNYDAAVALAVDLRDLARRDDAVRDFDERFAGLRKRSSRRLGFHARWRLANKAID